MPFHFWYIYATTGSDGFLLDIVRRPTEAVARLAVYRNGRPPRIVRRGFDVAELDGVPGELGVRLNRIAMDALGCRGETGGIGVDASFTLSGRSMRFVPSFVTAWFDQVPDFRSHYGALERGACGDAAYRDVPLVYSTYTLNDLAAAKWVLISAPRFPGTDLAFEISAARILGRWMPTAWLYFGGRERRFNPLQVRVGRAGDVENGERVFTASIHGQGVRFDITARGDTAQFARLDAEGATEIQTTLFGSCRVASGDGKSYAAERTCLLEVKS